MIPFLDLRAQHAALEPELTEAVRAVIAGAHFVLGPNVAAFEREFAAYCGGGQAQSVHAVALNTGTSALHLALLAAGVGPGCEVVTVPATFVATVAAILYCGATARLVDIDPTTWTMDPGQLEAAITPRTKAILPVHLHGRLADMAAITAIARRHGIAVIEDAAQAHGAEQDGVRAGRFGDIGCFSFYPGKNLGACGEGGAVVTTRPDWATRIRRLHDWGQERKYLHVEKGYNYRLDEMQAALLRVKLRHLEAWTDARRRVAARYEHNLAGSGAGSGIARPAPVRGLGHVWHVYAVRVADRDAVRARMAAVTQTGIHYPIPVHLQPAYAELGYRAGDFPHSEKLAEETLSLPIFPEMSEAQIDTVCAALLDATRSEVVRVAAE